MKNDLNVILNSVVKESALFLKDDMLLELVEIKSIQNTILDNHIGLIEFVGSKKFTVIISIEENLFEVLFNKFFKDGVEDDEKVELVDALPDEIINTVTGLAIRNFPLNCDDLVLGTPLKVKKENILKIIDKNVSQYLEIITKEGSFICIVIENKV